MCRNKFRNATSGHGLSRLLVVFVRSPSITTVSHLMSTRFLPLKIFKNISVFAEISTSARKSSPGPGSQTHSFSGVVSWRRVDQWKHGVKRGRHNTHSYGSKTSAKDSRPSRTVRRVFARRSVLDKIPSHCFAFLCGGRQWRPTLRRNDNRSFYFSILEEEATTCEACSQIPG